MSLPSGIGPHEGIEFDLLIAGRKNVALFFDYEPDGVSAFSDSEEYVVERHRAIHKNGLPYTVLIIYRVGYEGDAHKLISYALDQSSKFDPDRERDIGRILSYADWEIEAFIEHHMEKIRRRDI